MHTSHRKYRSSISIIFVALSLSALAAYAGSAALEAKDASVSISGTSPVTLEFPVSRSGGDAGYPIWLHYRTRDDSAVAGTDYTAASGELELPIGTDSAGIPVRISGASAWSQDKQFTLEFPGVVGVGPEPQFSAQQDFAAGSFPTAVESADMNGDGRPDLVAANNYGDSISVFFNTAPAGAMTPDFSTQQTITVGYPEDIVLTDVDVDGMPDIVVANNASDGITVLLNITAPGSASASFQTQQFFATGLSAGSVTATDLNADGKPDVVVTDPYAINNSNNTIAVLMNTTAAGASAPSFAAYQSFTVGSYPLSVTATDVNADGRPDLAVANGQSHSVSVLLNTTAPGVISASFTGQYSFATGYAPTSVAASDVNGDGRPDLVTADEWDDQVSVLLNTTPAGPASGSGAVTPAFRARQAFSVGTGPKSVVVEDLTGDGKPDIATVNYDDGTVSVLQNISMPGADDADFSAQKTFAVNGSPFAVTAAALNGDGKPDLVTANGGADSVSVLLNASPQPNADPEFVNAGEIYFAGPVSESLAVDLNSDGRPDLLKITQFGTMGASLNRIVPGTQDLLFGDETYLTYTGNGGVYTTLADINMDGKPDIILTLSGFHDLMSDTWSYGHVQVRINTTAAGAAKPSFAEPVKLPQSGLGPTQVSARDMNGDGKPDMVFSQRAPNRLAVILNTTAPGATTASFATEQTFAMPGYGAVQVATPDLNGDGKPDVILREPSAKNLGVMINATASGATSVSFSASQSISTAGYPDGFVTPDVNGDGKPDIVLAKDATNVVDVLLNTTAAGAGTASFAGRQSFATDVRPRYVRTGDINGDGRPDLVTQNDGDYGIPRTYSVLLNTTPPGSGTAGFRKIKTFTFSDISPALPSLADMNGDGVADMIMPIPVALFTGYTRIYFNNQYHAAITPASVTGTIQYAIPEATLSPGPLAFGNVVTGSSESRAVLVSSSGGDTLAISNIDIGGADAARFSQSNNCPVTLAVGESCEIQISYAPDALDADSASLSVASSAGNSPDILALTGAGIDTAPTAHDASVTTSPDTAVSGTLDVTDPDPGQTLVYRITAQPAHGTVSIADPAKGTFTYTPDSGYLGKDSFSFMARDGYKDSNTATISIAVNNSVPVARDSSITATAGQPVEASLRASDPDPGQSLTYRIVQQPIHGMVTITDTATGDYRYTAGVNYAGGSDSFTFQVNDGHADSNTATVSIKVDGNPPIAFNGSMTIVANTTASGQLRARAMREGRPLRFSVASPPAHGKLKLNPDTGVFTYTPARDFTGTDRFRFVADDGINTSAPAVQTIRVYRAGGGGAFGLWGLLLLAALAFRRLLPAGRCGCG